MRKILNKVNGKQDIVKSKPKKLRTGCSICYTSYFSQLICLMLEYPKVTEGNRKVV